MYLRELLRERRETNESGYDICSVSVSKGVVNQIQYLGRSFSAKETFHYHVVRYGDIVYTKSPTGEFPYGIIKQSYINEAVAVSPLYGVYAPSNTNIGVFLHHYFESPAHAKNYLHPLIQKGAKNTINITNQHFLDNVIPLPPTDILEKTVSVILRISEKLNCEEMQLSLLNTQKKFLLNQMFI